MSKFNNLIVYLPNYKLLKMKTKLYNYNWTSHQSKSIAEYHYELCHWLVYLCIYLYWHTVFSSSLGFWTL